MRGSGGFLDSLTSAWNGGPHLSSTSPHARFDEPLFKSQVSSKYPGRHEKAVHSYYMPGSHAAAERIETHAQAVVIAGEASKLTIDQLLWKLTEGPTTSARTEGQLLNYSWALQHKISIEMKSPKTVALDVMTGLATLMDVKSVARFAQYDSTTKTTVMEFVDRQLQMIFEDLTSHETPHFSDVGRLHDRLNRILYLDEARTDPGKNISYTLIAFARGWKKR
ncbi:hypothetical protein T439DRAFT_359219 [Meredithblackwellia eburnea MCA 4105]